MDERKKKSVLPSEEHIDSKKRRSTVRKSFEDARKTDMVRLPESTVERLFHKNLIKALEIYTGKKYTRKEVQLQSGVYKYLEALCNIISNRLLSGAKLFTTSRSKVTTKRSDIACSLTILNRDSVYGNLLVPAIDFKSDDVKIGV